MHPFLGMHDGLEDKACLLTTDTGDAGSSPHVARRFFQWCSMTNIAIYIIKKCKKFDHCVLVQIDNGLTWNIVYGERLVFKTLFYSLLNWYDFFYRRHNSNIFLIVSIFSNFWYFGSHRQFLIFFFAIFKFNFSKNKNWFFFLLLFHFVLVINGSIFVWHFIPF